MMMAKSWRKGIVKEQQQQQQNTKGNKEEDNEVVIKEEEDVGEGREKEINKKMKVKKKEKIRR